MLIVILFVYNSLEPVMAYERCFFMGDEFGSKSFEQYFQARKSVDYNSYCKAHFDVTGYFNNTFSCENPSVISRISNLFV